MWNWVTTYSDNLMALGTHQKVYIENGGYYNNITPLRLVNPTIDTPDSNNCVYTDTVEPNVVTIQLPVAHEAETGDFVEISGVTGTIGGIPASQINGNHEITVVTGLAFTIPVTSTVTSSVITGAGGTSIILDFEIRPGYAITTAGYGWGTGTWSRGAWGLGSTEPIFFPQRDWWFDNFDNDLVMNIRNGAGYWWVRGTTPDPGTALSARAITLQKYAFDWATATSAPTYTPTEYAEAVPTKIMQLLVSQQDRHLIAFGAVPFGSTNPDDFDPMLIRWADQDTPEDWIPQPTNTAGDIRVSRGSRIVRALPSRQEILVWTDSHLFTLQFLGTTDVFGLQEYADNISIISSRAVTTAANITYWMGQDKFYAYTGRVETLPCTLRNHVFQNINISQADQVVCGTNEQWNEVWWFYPTNGSDYNNAYVVYNHLERIWYYGTIERTAWLDTALRRYPQGANTPLADFSMGQAYNHEDGIDDDADAMVSYIQSSDFDLADGDQFMLCRRIIPDVGFSGSTANDASVTMQIRSRNFPGSALSDNAVDSKPVIETSVDQYTDQVFLRARARQMALKIQSETLGVQWQLGAPRLDAREDGRR